MAGLVNFKDPEEVKEYLSNTEIEFMFGCHKEKDADCCYRLGEFLETIRKKFPEAATTYKECCDNYKNAPCCFKVGQYHMLGKGGLEKSELEAFKYYRSACQQEKYRDQGKNDRLATACCNMALLLQQDEKSRKPFVDYLKTVEETEKPVQSRILEALQKSCALNDAVGCNVLSSFHMKGFEDLKPNLRLAAKYAEKSCDLGDYRGCHNISLMHARGDGVEKSYERAKSFSEKKEKLMNQSTSLSFGNT
ncbi:cytochrome c oxidase assembly factor 7B-like [Ciona intestinalis]